MAWQLTYQGAESVPVEVENVTPERLAGMSVDQARAVAVMVGNRTAQLGDLFDVKFSESRQPPAKDSTDRPSDDLAIDFHGDLSGVHWIGASMSCGEIRIHGPAGRHVGSGMTGGRIEVNGHASDWVGGEMHGGMIHVHGRAGHLVGAAYRGSRRGMTGGTILIDEGVGNELGHTMRRGLIAVGGDAGDLIGFNMLAGTILTFGQIGIRHGAGMKRGTLALLGPEHPPILPTFRFACRCRPLALSLLLQELSRAGFQFDPALKQSDVALYNGDFVAGGRGELLLSTTL